MTEASKTKLFLILLICNIREQTENTGDWRIVILPVELIGHMLVIFTADNNGMASTAFVIKKGEHIDVYLVLILVQMDIVR